MSYYIYKITSPKSPNCYIGITGDHVKRFRDHKRDLNKRKHSSVGLQALYDECPDLGILILETIDNWNDGFEREKHLIETNLFCINKYSEMNRGFKSKPEKSVLRSVRVATSVEDKIKAHCGTLAQGLRNYAELLDDVNVKLKNLNK